MMFPLITAGLEWVLVLLIEHVLLPHLQREEKKRRGKIADLENSVLREHRVEMVNTLNPKYLITHLKQNKVLDNDDVVKIEEKCKELRRKGAETMFDIVYNSGGCAFKKLIADLQQAGYEELAQKLTEDIEKKNPSPVKTPKQSGPLSHVELEALRDNHVRLVEELDSSVLKNYLFQYKIIDEDDLERITMKEEELRREGAEELVTIIHNSGKDFFPGLLKSLAEAGYDELSSKLDSDFKQKKDLVSFPDYPVIPELILNDGNNNIANVQQEITKWKAEDKGISWCVAMNNWFKTHEFKSTEEIKFVVKYWLLKIKQVVGRGCLEIDKINMILDVTQKLLTPDIRSHIDQDDMHLIVNIIKGFEPEFSPSTEIIQTKKTEKKRLLEQQRRVIEVLKHNLEGIIEGKQDFELPIDTEKCQLATCFPTVADDVKEILDRL